jgi:hypothetical protein
MKKSLFTALAVGLCITANLMAQVPSYVPTNGLVGWWPFNGNANDESGNGNNLTNNGGVFISDRNGTPNSACGLSNVGTSLSALNVIPSLSSNLQSISYWVQLPTQYNYSTLTLATNGVAYTNGSHLFIDQNDGAYGINNYLVGILISNGQSISFTTNQSELGNWNNVVFTYDGNQLNIYFNGILKSSLQYSGALNPPNNNLLFANWGNPSVPSNTIRNIDDIGIWNRALTQEEITDLYNATNLGMDNLLGDDLKIYPNPSNDYITIDAGNLSSTIDHRIKIEDVHGQEVFQSAVNQKQFYVDLSKWSGNGLYFVHLIDPQNNIVTVRKIVLQ